MIKMTHGRRTTARDGTAHLLTSTATVDPDVPRRAGRPPAVRLVRGAPGAVRLRGHLRTGRPDGPMWTVTGSTWSTSSASWGSASCGTRAATSSPGTGGRTAWVRWRSGRAGWTWRGTRWRPTPFGLGEFIGWTRLAGVEPMLAVNLGTRGIEAACDLRRVREPSGRYPAVGPEGGPRFGRALRREAVVPGQRDGRPLADRAQDRRRVRAAGRRGGAGDEAGRPRHRTRRVRILRPGHADVRAVGGDGAGARLRRGRLPVPARLLRGARRGSRQLPRLRVRDGLVHRRRDRDV